MQIVAHDFEPDDFVGGHVALDFTNTVTSRDTSPCDWLDSYSRLLEWARKGGVFDAARAAKLEASADRAPREAAASLGRARKLRESLHDVFVSLLDGSETPAVALAEVEGAWKRATSRAHLAARDRSIQFQPDPETSGLDLPLDLVVFAAVDLLGEIDTDRTRVCRGNHCGWLFIDSSKGGRRVWCDMATCGNTAKSARFARAEKRRRRKA